MAHLVNHPDELISAQAKLFLDWQGMYRLLEAVADEQPDDLSTFVAKQLTSARNPELRAAAEYAAEALKSVR
jgi:hypothetical protein